MNTENLVSFLQKNISNDADCQTFLNIFLPLLDQVTNFKEVSEIGIQVFSKNKDNECLKKHLLDTIFSGEDFNVMHYSFCRKLYKANIMITIQDIHEKLEKILLNIHENKLKPPLGIDFRCIILATPLIFFPNEIKETYGSDYTKYCHEIKNIFDNSPKINRIPPKWLTPLNIRNEIYDLMDGNNTFDPDDMEKVIKVAGDPSQIPHVKIY